MIVLDLQPPSIVEDRGFQQLLKIMDHRYIPPCRRSIMRDHIPMLYESAKLGLRDLLKEATYCSITTDIWTSLTTMSFMTVTCHFLTEKWELKSVVLDTPRIDVSHTAVNLAAVLVRIADEWAITSKVACAITDNANNIVAAIRIAGWEHSPCFAHTINLIVTNSIAEVPEVEELIQASKKIVSFFHWSTKASDKLDKVQTQLNIEHHKLIQHVETRWNSVYYMLELFIEQYIAIRTALCLLDRNDLIISMEKMDVIKEIIEILRPFEQVTREMSADSYVSISKIIPLSKALQRLTVITDGVGGTLSEKLSARMRRKFLSIEENRLLANSTLLDPRLKKLAFADDSAAGRAARFISSEAAAHQSRDNDDTSPESSNSDRHTEQEDTTQVGNSGANETLWQLLDRRVADNETLRNPGINATTEMQQYMKNQNLKRKEDPIAWWKEHSSSYPLLQNIAKKYLSIPGTSVPAERLFSTAGKVVSARRNRLKPENVNTFLFLNKLAASAPQCL